VNAALFASIESANILTASSAAEHVRLCFPREIRLDRKIVLLRLENGTFEKPFIPDTAEEGDRVDRCDSALRRKASIPTLSR
jgi:hypothetical protein